MTSRSPILLFIPAYNCEQQIVRVLDTLVGALPDVVTEIIVVDNGSQDQTQRVTLERIAKLPQLNAKLFFFKNRRNVGLGGSHKVAYNYAQSRGFKGVITLHGDDQAQLVDFTNVINRWSKHEIEADAILGSRFAPGASLRGYSVVRIGGNHV